MKTVTGLFNARAGAESAVAALEDAGIPSGEISVVFPGEHESGSAAEGAGIGAAVGGVGGLLAGLGAFAIPGIGPVVGAGWLATTLLGAAAGGIAGGLLGSFTEAGIDEDDAHTYAEGIRRGGALVTARVDEEQVDAAAAILRESGSVDISQLRSEYEAGGWTAYDPLYRPEIDEQTIDNRDTGDGIIRPPLPR